MSRLLVDPESAHSSLIRLRSHCFEMHGCRLWHFTIGYPEAERGFLIGRTVLDQPIVSARVYGPGGRFRFEVRQNRLMPSARRTYRRMLTPGGWRIENTRGESVFQVTTRWQTTLDGFQRVTRLKATLYDFDGSLICHETPYGILVDTEIGLPYTVGAEW